MVPFVTDIGWTSAAEGESQDWRIAGTLPYAGT